MIDKKMNKLLRWLLLFIVQFLLIFLSIIAIYSFIKARGQKINIKDNLRHIGLHYFFGFMFFKRKKNSSIMIHAISLGEVDAAINLINYFEQDVKEKIILTVTSIQAFMKIRNSDHSMMVLYFPFDSLIHQMLFVSHFNIKKAIIIEHDIWPNFLAVMSLLKREVVILNGHLSNNTIKHLSFPFYRELMFSPIKNVYVQTGELKNKLVRIMPDLTVSVVPSYKLPLNNYIGNNDCERKFVTISNFHPEEIEVVTTLVSKLIKLDYKIILVPRHIHLFDDFILVLKKQYKNRIDVISECNNIEKILADIIFVKSYGVLSEIYSLSHASIVFGSFDKTLKGHSLFEPLLYGSMVYYGPYYSSQEYMNELLHHVIPDINHDINIIYHQIRELSTQDRLRIYNNFIISIEKEKSTLINHFKEIEKWIQR
jgi:3-deoxy-D-manno-octulosonic-acid transferase